MLEEHFVEIEDQEGRLAGILHLPRASSKPCPAIIYCPGKNGERFEVHRLAVKFARRLAAQGIAFLRYDYYGMGLSDGHYYEVTTSTKISNSVKAYELLQSHPAIDSSRVAYLGFSDGARIALMSANRTNVDHLLLWSPLFYEFGNKFLGPNPRFSRHAADRKQLVIPWAGLWVGINFFKDLQEIDLDREIAGFRGKSILIYGDDDPLVHAELEQMRTNRHPIYSNLPEHQVNSVPRAGHLFTSSLLEDRLMECSGRWIAEQWPKREDSGEEVNHVEANQIWR
jgi:pimeloyl-ACP methyl ester carboxylesterase